MRTKSLHSTRILCILLCIISLATMAFLLNACGSPAVLEEVQMILPADKTSYVVGDKFDPNGLTFVGVYSDGNRKPLTNFSWDKTGELTKDDTTITITCEGVEFTQEIKVETWSEKIILTLANGIDTCNLHGDGHVSLAGGVPGGFTPEESYWSWDGQKLEIWITCYEDGKKNDYRSRMELKYDDLDNLEFRYALRGRWTINYAAPAKTWKAVLTPDVKYPVDGSSIPAPTAKELAIADGADPSQA